MSFIVEHSCTQYAFIQKQSKNCPSTKIEAYLESTKTFTYANQHL